MSDYSQLPDYTFWLKLYRIIIEKNMQPMHQSHLSIFIVEPRFVEKLANAFPILFTPTKLLALLFWADAGHSLLCTGTQIQRSGVQFIAGFPDLIHVQFPVTVQWTSFFKINIYALISGLIIKQCLQCLSHH